MIDSCIKNNNNIDVLKEIAFIKYSILLLNKGY